MYITGHEAQKKGDVQAKGNALQLAKGDALQLANKLNMHMNHVITWEVHLGCLQVDLQSQQHGSTALPPGCLQKLCPPS